MPFDDTGRPSIPVWVPPGHYYSPIIDVNDQHVQKIISESSQHAELSKAEIPLRSDLLLDELAMTQCLNRLSTFYADLPYQEQKTEGLRYYYQNGFFEHGDGAVLFCMLRALHPRRYIEVGSGFSSCVAMDVNDRFFDRQMEVQFIEPFPERLLANLAEGDPYRLKILAKPLQDVPIEIFRELGDGDVLFIDSSHVAKTGSDVTDYLFRIFPELNPGVMIHIHDIFYPFEYLPQWLCEGRSWNEIYVLRAFLQYNSTFRIRYFNDYMGRRFRSLLQEKMPIAARNPGGSIWLQKTAE